METIGDPVRLATGRKFHFERLRLRSGSGGTFSGDLVRHPGAVCVLPLLRQGDGGVRVVMIRNHRFTVGRELWELPAGTLDRGEDPADCARRELTEETGYRAGGLAPLGTFYTTPGLTDELMHAFAAWDLTEVGQDLEEDEEIRVERIGAAEALSMVDRGELCDAKSMVTLLLGARRGMLERGEG